MNCALINQTPLPAVLNAHRDHCGQNHQLVIAKATWRLTDGRLAPAEQQAGLRTQPLTCRLGDLDLDPAQRKALAKRQDEEIVWLDHDLSPPKPAFDVLVAGYATAPQEHQLPYVDAGIRIGNKALVMRAHAPRYWKRGWLGQEAMPLAPVVRRVPITYAVADWSEGFALDAPEDEPVWLPWIEAPDHPCRRKKHGRHPAGLGFWPENAAHRHRFSGTYDDAWQQEVAPDLPKDFDTRFYNVAHRDAQLPAAPAAGTPISLAHLTEKPVIDCSFPAFGLSVEATTAAGQRQAPTALTPDTLIIEPDQGRMSIVWRILLPAGKENAALTSVRLFKSESRQA